MARHTVTKHRTVLIFSTKEARSYDHKPSLEVNVTPARLEDGRGVVNFSSYDAYGARGDYLNGWHVQTWARVESDGTRGEPYRCEPAYDVRIDHAEAARAIARTLDVIPRRLQKIDEQYGRAASFGVQAQRLALAVGAQAILFATRSGGTWHADAGYEHLSPADGAGRIDAILAKWRQPEPATYQRWTNAPADFDGFGTVTLDAVDVRRNATTWRRVEIRTEHRDWQETRYRSGNHAVLSERPADDIAAEALR